MNVPTTAVLEAGERMSLALRWSLFEEGRDISDADVLADITHDAEGQLHIAIDERGFQDFLQHCLAAAPAGRVG